MNSLQFFGAIVRADGSRVHVGWRPFGADPDGIAFNVCRSSNGENCTYAANDLSAGDLHLDVVRRWRIDPGNNVIRFESTGQDLANIDQVEIL